MEDPMEDPMKYSIEDPTEDPTEDPMEDPTKYLMEDPTSIQYLIDTFPDTPEKFDRVEVLETRMVRIDLVRWMVTMFKKYVTENHPDREKLLYYTERMASSHDKTNYLFKIQAALNLDNKIPINVVPGNMFYYLLFESHRFWTALTKEFVDTFTSQRLRYEYIFLLLKSDPILKGKEVILILAANKKLMAIMKQLEENTKLISDHIQIYEASEEELIYEPPEEPIFRL